MKSESSSSSLLLWCSKYAWTISSVIFPVLHAPYPVAQKCLPQYLFFSFGCSCWSILEVRPFIRFTIWLIEMRGGYSIWIWIWSLLTTPFKISTSSTSQIWMINSLHRFWMSPLSTWYRYFVAHTMWQVKRVVVWLPLRIGFPIAQRIPNFRLFVTLKFCTESAGF